MMKLCNNKISIYFNDNECQILVDKKIYILESINIFNSMIKNRKNFLLEFKKFVKDNKIFSLIIPLNIDIYLNYEINELIREYYTTVFEELNFIKINLYCIDEILNKKKYIMYNYNSIYYYDQKNIFIINYAIMKSLIKENNKMYIIGNNELELNNSNIYIFNNHKTYIIDEIRKRH